MISKWLITISIFTIFMKPVAAEFRDPTQPLTFQPPKTSTDNHPEEFYLSGIMISNNHKHAIINGKTFRLNDRLGTHTIIAINENSVTIKINNNDTKTLYLHKRFYQIQ